MRIAYIVDVLDTGQAGTENQLIKMIDGLAARGHEIHLISLRHHPWLDQHGGSLRCTVSVFAAHRFKRFETYRNIARLIAYLRRLRPDVVHTFFPVANAMGVVAARLAGCRSVVSSRRDYGEWMSRRYLWATHLADRFVSAIVANSNPVKSLTVSAERVDPERVLVVYNGIDAARFERLVPDLELKRRLGIAPGSKVITKVANFRPMKRHRCLLMAAEVVLRSHSDIDIVLVGSDAGQTGLKGELQSLALALRIRDRVHFVGRQEDVVPYLSITDVSVNCSEGEGLSNAIMESMAAGIPCVAARSGGNTDLVQDGVTGRLFELDDHEGLARVLLEMLDDEKASAACVERARRLIREQMSMEAMLTTYERLYSELVSSGRGGRDSVLRSPAGDPRSP